MKTTKKLNYLLVMPQILSSNGEGYTFPFGIAYISSVMKKEGFNVFPLNLNHRHGSLQNVIEQEIRLQSIDVVMIGGLSFQYINIKEVVDIVRSLSPNIKIIVGGGIITGDPIPAMTALEYADFGVIGEGEATAVELAYALENNAGTENVSGVIFKDVIADNYVITTVREEIKDLDAVPFPDYEGFSLNAYFNGPALPMNNIPTNVRAFYIVGSRSCPYQCTFCFHTMGKKYRQRSLENILSEIKYLQSTYGVKHITMSDELFARDKKRVKVFSDTLKEWGISWGASFRVDDIDAELIEIIKSGTCMSMNFGIESADNEVLKSMRKHITIEQTEKALKLAYDAGIGINGNFIFGDIAETYESALKTLDWWGKHSEYNVGINFITVYPGAYIYKYAIEKGIITDAVKFLKDGCPIVNISRLSDDEMSLVARKILTVSLDLGMRIDASKLVALSSNGRITITGSCSVCHTRGVWENIKLFIGNNWFTCKNCGQRYVGLLPVELKEIIIKNVNVLLTINKKVVFWGITPHSLSLFDNEAIFKDDRILFVDNAETKQRIKIQSKPVFAPSILVDRGIKTVVCCYPNSMEQVSGLIRELYPPVKRVVNIVDLLYKTDEYQ